MWVSPRAAETNAAAVQNRGHLEHCARYGINPETNKLATLADCTCADWSDDRKCGGDIRPVLWYDPFSEDPKGLFFICEEHDGYYGSPTEGFFTCDACGKVHIENYTWENYYVVEDCEIFCMRCYAEAQIDDEDNWIDLRLPKDRPLKHVMRDMMTEGLEAGTMDPIEKLDFERVRRAKHLFPVECQDYMGLAFVGNVEFDSMSGDSISGGGVEGLKDLLRQAREEGYEEAMLVLDGAYQFAVSIGVYVREK